MKSIYIFTQLPNSYAPKRLKEEAIKLGLDAKIVPYKKVSIVLKEDNFDIHIDGQKAKAPDFTILRSSGKKGKYSLTMNAVLDWLVRNKVKTLNADHLLSTRHFDKLHQHIEFAKGGIPHIKSEVFMDLTILADAIIDYPVILKSFFGSHGDKVRKINKLTDIFYFSKIDTPVLMQPFLKVGKDVRVIVIGGKVLGAMLRTAQDGEYLTNFSQGGNVAKFNLGENPEVVEIAEKTARYFKCEYAGVDLMQDNESNWRVLEVNRFCQFEGFELSTGINVAKTLLEHITL